MNYCYLYYTGHLYRFFINQKMFAIEFQTDIENEYLMISFYTPYDIFKI